MTIAATLISAVQLALQYAPQVEAIFEQSQTNESIVTEIENLSAPLASLLTGIGSTLFPKAAPAIAIVGGLVASFTPNLTKWLQGSLNTLLGPALIPPLVVDGSYGPKTNAAVEQLQAKYGLKVDGLAGSITQGLISALLAKLPNLTPVTPTAPAS